MSILGDRIKGLRNAKGLNQTELSEALNQQFGLKTDRVMISKWETDFQTPIMSTIVCLAKFFNVSIDYLNGNEQPTPTLSFTPDPAALTQNFLTFSWNGKPGGRDTPEPSVDTINEINKLAKILRLCPAEEITALLKLVQNGGNIPLQAELPAELRELVTVAAKLPQEDIETLILLAKKMNK